MLSKYIKLVFILFFFTIKYSVNKFHFNVMLIIKTFFSLIFDVLMLI